MMESPSACVALPDLVFNDETPVSPAYGDVYFSRLGGEAETRHVFLAGNGLPGRWQEAGAAEGFTLVELGFGTGLNFLVTWQEFLKNSKENQRLHYVAIERFPLTPVLLAAALALQPGVAELAAQLQAAYPLRLPGIHRLQWGRVSLTLAFGEAIEMLHEISDLAVDAWFLDGFSPAKNPAMWSDAVLAAVGASSHAGTTLATFTVARAVRDRLAAQGFVLEKRPGFAHKRDMLIGRKEQPARPVTRRRAATALVIGAGIAGASVAEALARRGYAVTVVEEGPVAGGASGNPAGVLFPQLSKHWSLSSAWYFAAYSYVQTQLARLPGVVLHRTGMLRLPRHAAEEAQLTRVNETLGLDRQIVHWLSSAEASEKAGLTLASGAAYFPEGAWLSPPDICRALLQHEAIRLLLPCRVVRIEPMARGWRAVLADGEVLEAEQLVLAAAHRTAELLPGRLPMSITAGQISLLPASAATSPLRSILCRKGYLIPAGERYVLGATYEHHDHSGAVTPQGHAHNLAELQNLLPGWYTGEAAEGRTSLRAATPDRLPYVGEVEPGLWVSVGHGSRGMLSAPLAAEIIAGEMTGEPPCVTRAVRAAVRPQRQMRSTSGAGNPSRASTGA